MQGLLTQHCKLIKVLATVSAGTSAQNGTAVDMQADGGWDGVVFLGSIGTAAADNTMKVQQGDASNGSDGADLEGSELASDGTQTQFVIDVYQPQGGARYLRPVLTRATSTTVESVWALLYKGKTAPVTSASAALAQLRLIQPIEGTA